MRLRPCDRRGFVRAAEASRLSNLHHLADNALRGPREMSLPNRRFASYPTASQEAYMNNEPDDHVVTGDEDEPDLVIDPVEADQDGDDLYDDPEMGDMQNIPEESFEADFDDDKAG